MGAVGKYVDHVYGEKEIGGTQVMHLSGVPFELLDKPALPDVAPASISESVQHAIYNHLIAPVGFLGALAFFAWKNMRAPEPAAGDDEPQEVSREPCRRHPRGGPPRRPHLEPLHPRAGGARRRPR